MTAGMKALWLGSLAIIGCGGSKSPPVEPAAPVERPVEVPADAAIVEAPVDEPERPAVAAGPPTIAPACRGERLDLKTLVASGACVVQAAAAPLPAAIAITLEPQPLKLKAGAIGSAAIVLANTGAAEVTLLLEHACDRLVEVTYEMRASNGDRIDVADGGCGGGHGCDTKTIGVALPAKGQLRLAFPLIARIEKFDAECRGKRVGGPVPKGTYDLNVFSAFPDQGAKITIY